NGALTESGVLTVNGAGKRAILTAGAANNITLDTQNNDFTAVAITSGNDVKVKDANAIELGASTVNGNLGVLAKGTISESGVLNLGGPSTFTIDTVIASVLLGSQANHLGVQALTINSVNGGSLLDVSVRNVDAAASSPTLPP